MILIRIIKKVFLIALGFVAIIYLFGMIFSIPQDKIPEPVSNPVFPANFYFGASTSAYQVEGDNHNQWSEWEAKHAIELAQNANPDSDFGGGAGFLPIWELIKQEAKNPANYISSAAADHFHRYPEDLKLAAQIGLNAYRFSLEWSRLEPEEGAFNDTAFNHYRDMIQCAKAEGLEPFVGLWHWTEPIWFSRKGGWLADDAVPVFKAFVQKVQKELGPDVRFWIPMNEIEVYAANSYMTGIWPPQTRNFFKYRKVIKQLVKAHFAAYEILKNGTSCQVGSALGYTNYESAGGVLKPIGNIIVRVANHFLNHEVKKQVLQKSDFLGLNYYMRCRIKGIRLFSPQAGVPRSDMGWDLYPQGILLALRDLKRYGIPIYITESSLADRRDFHRPWYLRTVLSYVSQALQEGIDVRGYFHWSLLDNFEWDKGFWPRFGLIEVDRKTLARTIRPSARVLSEIIAKSKSQSR